MASKPRLNKDSGINFALAVSDVLNCGFYMLGNGRFCLLDKEDMSVVSDFIWHSNFSGYATSHFPMKNGKQKTILMHRLILKAVPGQEVDHINRIRYDNRKCNLRFANDLQTSGNRSVQKNKKSSKFRGVYGYGYNGKFRAMGMQNGTLLHFGCFWSEIEAAKSYNEWAKKHFGEFAYLNPV